MLHIATIAGDGIGPEVVGATVQVLDSMDLEMEFIPLEAGLSCHRERGSFLPGETVRGVTEADSCLLGAVTSPPTGTRGYRPVVPGLRRELDLYANVRPVRSLSGDGPDMIIVRENTEGLYIGKELVREREDGTHEYMAERLYTEKGLGRICGYALNMAVEAGRSRVTCVHKANVMRLTDGAFRDIFFREAARFPGLRTDELFVDAAAMFMITEPARFDVVVTTNLYGDILSDEAAGLIGGLGSAPSGNIGDGHSIFEPVHGSAPDIAGKGIANPTAAMLSAAMMLEHLGNRKEGERLERAVRSCYMNNERTRDQGGTLGTDELAGAVIRRL